MNEPKISCLKRKGPCFSCVLSILPSKLTTIGCDFCLFLWFLVPNVTTLPSSSAKNHGNTDNTPEDRQMSCAARQGPRALRGKSVDPFARPLCQVLVPKCACGIWVILQETGEQWMSVNVPLKKGPEVP